MIKSLDVWWDDARAGDLQIDGNSDLEFVYDEAWLQDPGRPAISISLPKRPAPFNRRQTRPFFARLLPEQMQRDAGARALGVSPANNFDCWSALAGCSWRP